MRMICRFKKVPAIFAQDLRLIKVKLPLIEHLGHRQDISKTREAWLREESHLQRIRSFSSIRTQMMVSHLEEPRKIQLYNRLLLTTMRPHKSKIFCKISRRSNQLQRKLLITSMSRSWAPRFLSIH